MKGKKTLQWNSHCQIELSDTKNMVFMVSEFGKPMTFSLLSNSRPPPAN